MVNKIEEKLKEYRLRKEKERYAELLAQTPLWQRVLPETLTNLIKTRVETKLEQPTEVQETDNHQEDESSQSDSEITLRQRQKAVPETLTQEIFADVATSSESKNTSMTALDWLLLGLKFILWAILFKLSVEVEFGAVFVIFSLFYVILTNLRSGRRKPWEPSAYSVFNPGCEAIDGTLNAEQFEREIRHGF